MKTEISTSSRRAFLGFLAKAPLVSAALLAARTAVAAPLQTDRQVLMNDFAIAGFRYYDGAEELPRLVAGSKLTLRAESTNPLRLPRRRNPPRPGQAGLCAPVLQPAHQPAAPGSGAARLQNRERQSAGPAVGSGGRQCVPSPTRNFMSARSSCPASGRDATGFRSVSPARMPERVGQSWSRPMRLRREVIHTPERRRWAPLAERGSPARAGCCSGRSRAGTQVSFLEPRTVEGADR